MIQCAACGVPLADLTIRNTEAAAIIRCSCGSKTHINHAGQVRLATRLVRPEFVRGCPRDRLQELRAIERSLCDSMGREQELLLLVAAETQRILPGVRDEMMREFQVESLKKGKSKAQLLKMLIKTLGQEEVLRILAEIKS